MRFLQKLHPIIRFAATILFLITFVNCSQKSQPATKTVPADTAITSAIQAKLNSATNIPAQNVNITTEDGIVTMSGSTTNLLAKKNATDIAQATAGVVSVVNNLSISASRPDAAINQDVAQALGTNPATENWEIGTKVNNGLVTLTGIVDSWQEKQLAGKIVSGVKGVKEIKNSISIAINTDRKASDIKAEIKSALMFDSRIHDKMIKVEVSDGTVTLSGAVGSAQEKQLAIENAHVRGVEKVIAKNLEVKPEYDSKIFINKAVNNLTSSQIEGAIEKAFAYDPEVPADKVSVELNNGTAQLSGSVRSLSAKLAAADDARHTTGVENVTNNISVERKVVVKPAVPTTDEAIKNHIKNAIRRDPYVEEAHIELAVSEGVVELSGTVNSKFEKRHIYEIASDVKGVIKVYNTTTIKPKSGETMYE